MISWATQQNGFDHSILRNNLWKCKVLLPICEVPINEKFWHVMPHQTKEEMDTYA